MSKKDQVHFRLRLLSTISLKPKNIHSHVAQYSENIFSLRKAIDAKQKLANYNKKKMNYFRRLRGTLAI